MEMSLTKKITIGVGVLAGIVLSGVVSSRRFGIWRDSAAIAFLAVVTIAYVSLNGAGGSEGTGDGR